MLRMVDGGIPKRLRAAVDFFSEDEKYPTNRRLQTLSIRNGGCVFTEACPAATEACPGVTEACPAVTEVNIGVTGVNIAVKTGCLG